MKFFGYRSKKPWKMILASFVYALVFTIIVIAIINPSSEPASSKADNEIEAVINNKIGETTNNDKPTYIEHNNKGNQLNVHINTSDNLTTGLMKTSMYGDAIDVFSQFFNENDADEIQIVWYSTLVDQKGNESNDPIMKMTFTQKNADTINWDNMVSDNMPKVANSYWEHPAVKE